MTREFKTGLSELRMECIILSISLCLALLGCKDNEKDDAPKAVIAHQHNNSSVDLAIAYWYGDQTSAMDALASELEDGGSLFYNPESGFNNGHDPEEVLTKQEEAMNAILEQLVPDEKSLSLWQVNQLNAADRLRRALGEEALNWSDYMNNNNYKELLRIQRDDIKRIIDIKQRNGDDPKE